MVKIVGYWSAPDAGKEEEFEKHYAEVHIQLASKLPKLKTLTAGRADRGFAGGDPVHYRTVELTYDSEADMEASMASPEWAAMAKDAEHVIETYGAQNSGDYVSNAEVWL